ncbi:unnamed protein product [Kuraishia capsulata CBS 1993]|uniref:RanBD1 domain-containing protein n=1 Tax=Kuraishia capsulata CBS 1993 TaxID=1382522 RepID=W6MN94_9ASCO|nr:uncharacterized protein KUCA_T00004052001 [Kuraishia capsulata CBS 1993]CDK28071.1 unnamed protein product [Kuraishia capsulata CBS 1993]
MAEDSREDKIVSEKEEIETIVASENPVEAGDVEEAGTTEPEQDKTEEAPGEIIQTESKVESSAEKNGGDELVFTNRKRAREESDEEEEADSDSSPEETTKKQKIEAESAETEKEAVIEEKESTNKVIEKFAKEETVEATAIDEKSTKPEKPAEPEKPKFVFGSRSTFGARPQFTLFQNKPEEKDKADVPAETKVAPSTFSGTASVFGSKSVFGNAFQAAINKESIFKAPEATEEAKTVSTVPAPSNGGTFQKIHLEKQAVVSGEENEKSVFSVRAKLYFLDLTNVEIGWKEKGVGQLKVNQLETATETYTSRILMRQDAIFKLILNCPLSKDIKVFKGLDSSLSREKFVRIQAFENGKPVQYAAKVKSSEDSQALYDTIIDLIPK